MSMADQSDNETVPGTVFTPRQVRVLKIAVIAMGLILVGGFAFVLAAIVYQASHATQGKAGTAVAGGPSASFELPVPPNATISAMSLEGNRLAVQVSGADGSEIVVLDLASGKVAARVRLTPK